MPYSCIIPLCSPGFLGITGGQQWFLVPTTNCLGTLASHQQHATLHKSAMFYNALQDFRATLPVDLLNIHHGSPAFKRARVARGYEVISHYIQRGKAVVRNMEQQLSKYSMQFQLYLQQIGNWENHKSNK